ncbi:Succinate/fumarate mitochondrial transporter [Diplonema papillatum]|nr:Succinate/fumarate mitochondrial transporter [Diplonema papillatum]
MASDTAKWKQAATGATAGLVEAVIMHPVDTVKTRVQAERVGGVRFAGVADAVKRTFTEEGFGAFYKGLAPVVLSVVPKVAIQYVGLATFLPFARQLAPEAAPRWSHASAAGVLTGVVQATLVVAPLELLKNRQQVLRTLASAHDAKPPSLRGLFGDILRTEGVRGFYKGLLATVLRQCWGLFIKFGGYMGLREVLTARLAPGERLQPYHHMLCGGGTNVLVGLLVSPLDVVKTRLQLSEGPRAPRIRDCVSKIVREEGWQAFFRGASMRVVRIAPGGAIQFATAEWVAAHIFGVRIG